MKAYERPSLEPHGNIHDVTGFTSVSTKLDFAWGPSGEPISNNDDHGSNNYCQQPDGSLVPCEAPPGD